MTIPVEEKVIRDGLERMRKDMQVRIAEHERTCKKCRLANSKRAVVAGTVRRVQRPDRNAPCPCGSGKKFKKCHLGAVEHNIAQSAKHDGARPRGGVRFSEDMCEVGRSLWLTYSKFTDGPIEIRRG